MPYTFSYSDQISLGMIDPDDYEPLTRCPGPAHPDAHGCGRFLAAQTSMCERCRTESEDYWREDIARMAQLDAEFDMQANDAIDAYWRSPEGQAEMANQAALNAEWDASGPLDNPDDLPY